MMEDDLTCGVCSEQYNNNSNEPVVLPCGHTFCRSCLQQVQKANKLSCPTCRKSHSNITVQQLPRNFIALSIMDNRKEYQQEFCDSHDGMVLNLWCHQCQQPLCGMCAYKAHPMETHDVVPSSVAVLEKKNYIKNRADEIRKLISNMKIGLNQNVQEVLVLLTDILGFTSDTYYLSQELSKNTIDAEKTKGIESTLVCQAKCESLHQQINKLASVYTNYQKNSRAVTGCDSASPGGDNKGTKLEENFLTKTETGSSTAETDSPEEGIPGEQNSVSGPITFVWPLTVGVHNKDGECTQLFWDGGRLFMPAFRDHQPFVSTHFSIQWEMIRESVSVISPEVFLELTMGDLLLGRVHIRLWGHLRRAQHFMALCLGTFGPSYEKSSLKEADKDGVPKTRIEGGYYFNGTRYPPRPMCSEALMDNLEWGGSYSGFCRKGLVIGSRNGVDVNQSLFRVCTSDKYTELCSCPFGEVLSGLEILRDAVFNNPEKTVIISKCGVVLQSFNDQ